MSRYIDVDKLEKNLRKYADKKCQNQDIEIANGILKAVSFIKQQSTADVKEVVHCKDCKFYHADGNWCDLNSHFLDEKDEPTLPSEISSWREFGDDDYCSKGVKK